MFSKDVQKVVRSKYENGDNARKICGDLNGCVGLRTIERWLKRVGEFSAREFSARNVQHGMFSTRTFSTRYDQHKNVQHQE